MRDTTLKILAAFVLRRPRAILVASAIVAAVAGWYGVATIRLNANLDDLIARDRPFTADYRAFLEEFGDLEHIYVVVDSKGDGAAARAAVDDLASRLRTIEGLPAVWSGVETSEQLRIATRAAPDEDLRGLALAAGAAPDLEAAGSASAAVRAAMERFDRLARERSLPAPEQERIGAEAALILAAVTGDREALGPLAPGAGRDYLVSETGRLYFIIIQAQKDFGTLAVIERPLREIRRVIDEARPLHPAVGIGLTGRPVLQADELATSNADMARASVIALALCSGLFILFTSSVLRPLMAVLAFAMASGWTYGAAGVLVGQLNLLSIVFMLVLIGVGLDYGVHVIARFREFRRDHDLRGAVEGTMLTAVRGNLTGAATSSIVFLAAWFTHFQGLRELGLIAGVGLILCFVAMTFTLPALLVLTHAFFTARDRRAAPADKPGLATRVQDALARRPLVVLAVALAVLVGLALLPGRPRFETNLLELQAVGLESIEWEHRIREDSAAATWFGAIIAPDLDEVRRVTEALRAQPTVGEVRSALDIVRPDTPERSGWRSIIRAAALAPEPAGVSAPADEPLSQQLTGAAERLGFLASGAAAVGRDEGAQLRPLADRLRDLAQRAHESPDAVGEDILASVRAVGASLRAIAQGDALPLREALPDVLAAQSVSPRGRYLVMAHPAEDVWEYDKMAAFIRDLREVDPRATGAPVSHFESFGEMRSAFITMSVLSLVAIIALLYADFRSWRDVGLCLVPLAFGLAWAVEAMAALGVSFNLANFFAVPILIGLSVDGGVHVLHRYHEGGPERFHLGATRNAVLLTALTTTIGFGALVIAHHRGLRSLGVAMAVGSFACMLASLIVLPAALSLVERFRRPRSPSPSTRRPL